MIAPADKAASFLSDFLSKEKQIQQAGVDLTLRKVFRFRSGGKIAFDNSKRKLSECEELEFNNGWLKLPPGPYKITFNEYIRIPKDYAALVLPRSSLLRCGASLHTALWDPGYEGRGEMLLVVHNPKGIWLERGSRIAQIVFFKLETPPRNLYEGEFKGEYKSV